MTCGVGSLRHEDVREALRLLGHRELPSTRAGALADLRAILADHVTLRTLLDRAPEGGRRAFVRLAHDGPATVEDLLQRGWWGRGALPPPLDWLQRRALVVVGDDGLVHAVEEAMHGYLDLVLDLREAPDDEEEAEGLTVEGARSIVVAPSAVLLDRAVSASGAGLRALSPTVAASDKGPATVTAALRAAGLPLVADAVVHAEPAEPALPGTVEDAVGPGAIRALLDRALAEHRQVWLQYFASSRGGAATERVVDPWSFRDDLLRGYCHLRTGERTFALDRIGHARLLPTRIEQTS
jgi:hypothetical protein